MSGYSVTLHDVPDWLSEVYPEKEYGRVIKDKYEFTHQFVELALKATDEAAAIRWAFAITGAMRWPWSQEARIDIAMAIVY